MYNDVTTKKRNIKITSFYFETTAFIVMKIRLRQQSLVLSYLSSKT